MNNHVCEYFNFPTGNFSHCKNPVFMASVLFIVSNMCLIFNPLPVTTHKLS